jgi:hypothetical protein
MFTLTILDETLQITLFTRTIGSIADVGRIGSSELAKHKLRVPAGSTWYKLVNKQSRTFPYIRVVEIETEEMKIPEPVPDISTLSLSEQKAFAQATEYEKIILDESHDIAAILFDAQQISRAYERITNLYQREVLPQISHHSELKGVLPLGNDRIFTPAYFDQTFAKIGDPKSSLPINLRNTPLVFIMYLHATNFEYIDRNLLIENFPFRFITKENLRAQYRRWCVDKNISIDRDYVRHIDNRLTIYNDRFYIVDRLD